MKATAQQLNAALRAYIATVPSKQRLDEFIRTPECEGIGDEIRAAMAAVMSAADDFLYGQPGPIEWGPEFTERLFANLSARCPWLSRDGLAPILSYANWLSWREGL